MSAVHQLAPQEEIRSSGLPIQRPVARPVVKKKRRFGTVLAVTSVWAIFMVLSFALIQKNMAIREERAAISRMNQEIDLLIQRNLELQGTIDSATSIASVQQWAVGHQMVAPAGTIPALKGKPEAVAHRQAPEPSPAQVETAQAQRSLWQSLLARITGSSGQSAGAAR